MSTAVLVSRREHWQAFDAMARKHERRYEAAALLLFSRERREVIATLLDSVPGAKADDLVRRMTAAYEDPYIRAAQLRIEADYAPGGDYHRAWLRRYEALIEQTVQVGGQGVADAVGFRFNLENPRVTRVIRERAGDLVQHVTETTKEAIRAAVEAGRAQGMSVQEIAKLIEKSTFGEITKSRAVTIARTETVGALNAGEYEAAVASGVMRSKEWLSEGDERVRDSHVAVDGEVVPLGWRFSNGLLYPHEPGAPASEVVNCRCTCLYSDEEAP